MRLSGCTRPGRPPGPISAAGPIRRAVLHRRGHAFRLAGRRPAAGRTVAAYARSRLMRIYVPFLAWSGIYLAFKGAKAIAASRRAERFSRASTFVARLVLSSVVHAVCLAGDAGGLLPGAMRCAGRARWPRSMASAGPGPVALIAGCVGLALLPADRSARRASALGELALDALPSACWGLALAHRLVPGRGVAQRRLGWPPRGDRLPGERPWLDAFALRRGPRLGWWRICPASRCWFLRWAIGPRRCSSGSPGLARWPTAFIFRTCCSSKRWKRCRQSLHLPLSLATALAIFVLAAAGSTLLGWSAQPLALDPLADGDLSQHCRRMSRGLRASYVGRRLRIVACGREA